MNDTDSSTSNMNWHPYDKQRPDWPLPEERKIVLVQGVAKNGKPCMVGYLRYAAGDKLSPYFVTPGGDMLQVTHWCDCLSQPFYAPLWNMPQ